MTMIKDSYQFGIEPVRITDTDNIQVNEGLPTNADPQGPCTRFCVNAFSQK